MTHTGYKICVLLATMFVLPKVTNAQDSLAFDLSYDIHRVYPSLSITRDNLGEAHLIGDLSKYYKPSWVKEYISVEIMTSVDGTLTSISSINDIITPAQEELMANADVGADIKVKARYMPENNLTHNVAREMGFTFTVEPEKEAGYAGGKKRLKEYLKQNILDKVTHSSFKKHHLTAVNFTIDEEGDVVNIHVAESSNDQRIDEVLLETICNMPQWIPAEYADGTRAEQDFVLAVGDMRSCVVNLLYIRDDLTNRD